MKIKEVYSTLGVDDKFLPNQLKVVHDHWSNTNESLDVEIEKPKTVYPIWTLVILNILLFIGHPFYFVFASIACASFYLSFCFS